MEEIVRDNKALKLRVSQLEEKIDDLENYSRRNNIVIYGVPGDKEETPIEKALEICKVVGVEVEENDIDTAHHLRTRKEGQELPFIIKLVNRYKKEEIMRKTREMRPTADKLGGDFKKNVIL